MTSNKINKAIKAIKEIEQLNLFDKCKKHLEYQLNHYYWKNTTQDLNPNIGDVVVAVVSYEPLGGIVGRVVNKMKEAGYTSYEIDPIHSINMEDHGNVVCDFEIYQILQQDV